MWRSLVSGVEHRFTSTVRKGLHSMANRLNNESKSVNLRLLRHDHVVEFVMRLLKKGELGFSFGL